MAPPLIPPPLRQRRLFLPLCAVLLAPLFAATSATAQEERTSAKPWVVEGPVSTEPIGVSDTRDLRIDETRRRDKIWQVFASLSSNLLEQYDITPVLQYAYIKRESNIWSREYDRQRLNFSFNYRF